MRLLLNVCFLLKVTYPYIMAKVRIQAKGASPKASGDEEAGSFEDAFPPAKDKTSGPSSKKSDGAIDILAKVLKTEGFFGWYQVSKHSRWPATVKIYISPFAGNGGPNYKSRAFTGTTLHVERPGMLFSDSSYDTAGYSLVFFSDSSRFMLFSS